MTQEANGQAKLTWGDVVAIREKQGSGVKQVDLAKEYSVHQSTISDICSFKNWKIPFLEVS